MSEYDSVDKCWDMRLYYYDYLLEDKGQIPHDVLEHFSECQYCKNELETLKNELKQNEGVGEDDVQNIAEVANLELHFGYTNVPVGCDEARQFLALMASSLEVTATTPITVHINNCPSCSADLKTLKNLGLPEQNLLRIGKLMADKSITSLGEVEIGVKIFQAVSDIQCDKSTIDQLVEIVCRPSSGIKTLFNLKDGADCSDAIKDGSSCDNLVSFTVFDESKDKQSSSRETGRTANFKLSKYLIPIAAAAVIMVAFLFFNESTATADYDQIHKALKNVKNVHLRMTGADSENIIQEIWISRELNVKVLKSGSKIEVWDVGKQLKISKDTANGTIETNKIDDDLILQVSRTMQVPWSLLPFKAISNLPEGATWRIINENDTVSNIDLYEIIWTEKTLRGANIITKWRGDIDRETSLPKRVEWWNKKESEEDFKLKTLVEISYPGIEQIKGIVDKFRS